MKYQFQVAKVEATERPEYDQNEKAWEVWLEADTPESLLLEIADLLNDELYPLDEWVRITKDGKSLHQ